MNKTLLILIFSNFLHAELILEITQGIDNPYRVALVQFEGNENISKDINEVIRNNLTRSGEFKIFENDDLISNPSDETQVIFNDFKILDIDYLILGKIIEEGAGISVIYEIYAVSYTHLTLPTTMLV